MVGRRPPTTATQVPIDKGDGTSYFLDLGLPDERFAAEYDGRAWHSTDAQREHDRGRRAWIRTNGGWRIEEYDESHTFGHFQAAERLLRDAFAAHRGVRYL